MSSSVYAASDVPVPGGTLRVGVWEPATGDAPETVLAIHGVTANHQAFRALAARLPGVRVVAPDLRGRGRSADLPGPYGMPQHADDVAAATAHLGIERACVVGHSMGGFVSVVLAARHPGLVRRLVLVDGGLPLPLPPGLDPDAAMHAVLGPAASRLAMTFPDHAAYRRFWRDHPAFAETWTEDVEAYFDYDLVPAPGGYRCSTSLEALREDQRELYSGASLLPALEALAPPTTFVRAETGLLTGPPLYPREHAAEWARRLPLTVVEAPGHNHYGVVMADDGARLVAEQVAGTGEHVGVVPA